MVREGFGIILLISLLSTTYAQEYGYLVSADSRATVWWAEGAYKVMKQDPPPKARSNAVRLFCARNEYEPFILVLRPTTAMEDVRIEASPLIGPNGRRIYPANISVCHVGYVNVVVPTDEAGAAGEWPDPLPPYEGPFSAPADENHPFWITIKVPAEAAPGKYLGKVSLSSGEWKSNVPVALQVWNFALPDETHLRSAFGINIDDIRRYHNLETPEELEIVTDLYYQNLKAHRLAPISPLGLYPMRVRVEGLPWEGGEFVTGTVHSGRRSLKVEDNSVSACREAAYLDPIPVEQDTPYRLGWHVKTEAEDQKYTVLIQCYDAAGRHLHRWNQLQVREGSTDWREAAMGIQKFVPEVKSVSLHFFPTFRDDAGSFTGTAWFDDVVFQRSGEEKNLLLSGDMEMDIESLSVEVDFSDFDRGARRYLDGLGLNAFDLAIEGLGSGSFHSRRQGMFAGFRQGTAEYDRLLCQYLSLVEKHLADNGWLGKEYIYWFDEPDPKDYDFVREGMINIRKAAPRLTRFITEHKPGPDIMDVSEISCTIFHRVDPAVITELSREGREFWSYLCTGPKAPWVTLFIDHPAVNLRIWLWMSFQFGLKGILVWRANYWTSDTVFPDTDLQNPWEDPMSYTVGYGTPCGQVNYWGNGDGRFLYPPNRKGSRDTTKYLTAPINSVRWEILREGVEDYEYFRLLEKAVQEAPPRMKGAAGEGRKLLRLPQSLFRNTQDYTKDPRAVLEYRKKVAAVLERLL
jgi:hypothetical protein